MSDDDDDIDRDEANLNFTHATGIEVGLEQAAGFLMEHAKRHFSQGDDRLAKELRSIALELTSTAKETRAKAVDEWGEILGIKE